MKQVLKLTELISIYKREPTVRDIVVEGSTDQSILQWFLTEAGKDDCKVYQQSSFDIPGEHPTKLGLENGNRGRVIALAAYCTEHLTSPAQITCVADSDFDIVTRTRLTFPCLLFTDYANMEMYFWGTSHLSKYLTLRRINVPKTADEILDDIKPVLRELFAIRLVNQQMRWALKSVQFTASCSYQNDSCCFDAEDYFSRYLNKNSCNDKRGKLLEHIEVVKRVFDDEPRNWCHGHDFFCLLNWYISAIRGKKRATDADDFDVDFYSCVEWANLAGQPMFASLLSRMS